MKQNTHTDQELAKFKHETERVWERSECNYPVELPSLFLLDLDYLFTESTQRPAKSCGIVFGLAGTELIFPTVGHAELCLCLQLCLCLDITY